jgi:hypothetical protein
VKFCRHVYGSTIEALPARGKKDPSFRSFLSKIKSETGSGIRKEVPPEDMERVENFFLDSRLSSCLPPLTSPTDSDEIDHVKCLQELNEFNEEEAKVSLSQFHGSYPVV